LKKNQDFLLLYLTMAPFALAFERTLECWIYSDLPFTRPVLDLGCGEGLFAKIFFAEKVDTGIDPNTRELTRARELGCYRELIHCFGNAIPKADASYNTIFSNSVLEHITDLEPVLREVHRLLKPRGRFYLTVPSDLFDHYTVVNQLLTICQCAGLARRFRKFFNAFWHHYHFYSLEQWSSLARQQGFEVMESRYYGPKHVCLLNDFLVPFSLVGLLVKKLTNRWTLYPQIRRIVIFPFYLLAKRILQGGEKTSNGGLVFLSLKKPE
jgi:SAM-dependent methyltransferase